MGRFLAGGLAVLAVGCSSPASVNTDPIPPVTTDSTPATSAATTAPPVAESTTPTTAPATTTPPTTEADTTEADIREAVDEYFALVYFNFNTGNPRDPAREDVALRMTGDQLDRWLDVFETEAAIGRFWTGEFDYRVVDVQTSGSRSQVDVCLRDKSTGFESTGVEFATDDIEGVFVLSLEQVDELWKVETLRDGDTTCTVQQ